MKECIHEEYGVRTVVTGELIRCYKCKYFDETNGDCNVWLNKMKREDYCSLAVKKDGLKEYGEDR